MIKKSLLIGSAALLLSALTTFNAQALSPIKFGVKAGIQTQSMNIQDATWENFSASNNFGYQLGFMAQIPLGPIYLQPELVYMSARFKPNGDLTDQNGQLIASDLSGKYSVNNIQVPVLVGIKVLFIRLFAGPTFNLMNDTSNKSGSDGVSFNSSVKKSTVGLQVGAGVAIGKFNIDIRYDGQFKTPEQTFTFGKDYTQTVKTKMNNWQLNFGYFF